MTLQDRYPDFGGPAPGGEGDPRAEEARLATYEEGYAAGWEDSARAHGKESERLLAELAQALEDGAFTYSEAERQVLQSLQPFFARLLGGFLPERLPATLRARLLEELQRLAAAEAPARVVLAVAPGLAAPLEELMAPRQALPYRIVESPELTPGQARLQVDAADREIDLSHLLAAFQEALDAFFDQINQEKPDD